MTGGQLGIWAAWHNLFIGVGRNDGVAPTHEDDARVSEHASVNMRIADAALPEWLFPPAVLVRVNPAALAQEVLHGVL